MCDWRLEEARNQLRTREFNEWIKITNDLMGDDLVFHAYCCECGAVDCHQVIDLSDDEYDRVRSEGARFAVAVNHENPELDRVVAEHRGFATVEKLLSRMVTSARAADPRSAPVSQGA